MTSTRVRSPSRPPNGNTKKAKGTRVNLVISRALSPPRRLRVPQLVVGLTKDQAEAAHWQALGLKGSASEEANEAEGPGL